MKEKVIVGIQTNGNAFCNPFCPYRDETYQGLCFLRSHKKPDSLPIRKSEMELTKRTKYCLKAQKEFEKLKVK